MLQVLFVHASHPLAKRLREQAEHVERGHSVVELKTKLEHDDGVEADLRATRAEAVDQFSDELKKLCTERCYLVPGWVCKGFSNLLLQQCRTLMRALTTLVFLLCLYAWLSVLVTRSRVHERLVDCPKFAIAAGFAQNFTWLLTPNHSSL